MGGPQPGGNIPPLEPNCKLLAGYTSLDSSVRTEASVKTGKEQIDERLTCAGRRLHWLKSPWAFWHSACLSSKGVYQNVTPNTCPQAACSQGFIGIGRHKEQPQRPFKIWGMDVSKQVTSSVVAHFCGVPSFDLVMLLLSTSLTLCSLRRTGIIIAIFVSEAETKVKVSECAWCFPHPVCYTCVVVTGC